MANAQMPDEFFAELEPQLPPEPEMGPLGGRPFIPHGIVMRVIWFVLATGCRWEDVPPEMGCSGRTAHRRLKAWEELGVWDHLHVHMLKLLKKAGVLKTELTIVDSVIVRAFGGGERMGPNPVDRRKPGSKHTLMVDRSGVPLVIHLAKANDSDQKQLVPTVLDFPQIKGTRGRPKTRADEVYADRGYDSQHNRLLLSWLGITPWIAKRNTPHGSGLGKVRWVVERTISWLKGLRRMRVRYDRSKLIQEAWNTLAAAVICFQIAKHDSVL